MATVNSQLIRFIQRNHPYYKDFNPLRIRVNGKFRIGQLAGAAIKESTLIDPVVQLENGDIELAKKLKDECRWGVFGV